MPSYYSVHIGRVPGIYKSWNDCKKQIDKYENAIFKKFEDKDEATLFLKNGFSSSSKQPKIVTRRNNDDIRNNLKITNETLDSNALYIYTDGSCIKNKAGYGIYIPHANKIPNKNNIKIALPLLNQKITNNRAELTAIIESINYLDEDEIKKKLCVFTDSQYSMYIFNGTGERYEKNNYKDKDEKDVPNIDLIKKILEIKRSYNIVLLKVRAHTDKNDEHSIGNDIADKLAGLGMNNLECNNDSFISDNFFVKKYDDFSEDSSIVINKNIKINELLEFDEDISQKVLEFGKMLNKNRNEISPKKSRKQKLTHWFIPK